MFSTVEAAFIFPADSLRAMRGHWIWGRAGLRRGDKPCQAGRCAAAVRWESGRDVSGYVGWAGAAGGDRKGNRRVLMTRVGGTASPNSKIHFGDGWIFNDPGIVNTF